MMIGTTTIGIIMMIAITNRGDTHASTNEASDTRWRFCVSWSHPDSRIHNGSPTLSSTSSAAGASPENNLPTASDAHAPDR